MKKCSKCKIKHNKKGKFCSRKCANSRIWSKKDKIKKSISAKNSNKVKLANLSPIKRKKLSLIMKKISKNRDISYLHTPKIHRKSVISLKKRFKNLRDKLDMNKYNNYKKSCLFRFNLKDYKKEFNFKLVTKYGWYKASNRGNNLNGVSRDHMYSIKRGFKNKVSPYYISHPANCMLMKHNENSKKYDRCSIKLEELIIKINKWNKKYKESMGG